MEDFNLDKRAVNDLLASWIGGLSYPELSIMLELLTEAQVTQAGEVHMTNAVLGYRAGITLPTVTHCCKSLERIGFFARTPGMSNRATVYRLNVRAMREFTKVVQHMFEVLRNGPDIPVVRKRTRLH